MKASMQAGMMALGCAAWVAGLSTAMAQGSLTPPGAPAPTMKTLAQVEPRTPITNAPCTLSQPGSYYLTANLGSTGHGVVIAASAVTLDLMGFTIAGDRGGADFGVYIDGDSNAPVRDVVVRNGFIRNFGAGVRGEYVQDSRFEQLVVVSNAAEGVCLFGVNGQCDGNLVNACRVIGNGNKGILLLGSDGQCNGNAITGCTISDNGGDGVFLAGFFGRCDNNLVSGCLIRKNAATGITVSNADGNWVEDNHIAEQTGSATVGIYTVGSARNMIRRNACVGLTNSYSITANDTYGPIVTDTGALPATGAAAHPWANFSR